MIILRPKNVIFERFRPLSKFHFPACSTLIITVFLYFCVQINQTFFFQCLKLIFVDWVNRSPASCICISLVSTCGLCNLQDNNEKQNDYIILTSSNTPYKRNEQMQNLFFQNCLGNDMERGNVMDGVKYFTKGDHAQLSP